MNAIKFWSVFVIGVAAGAGVALIYAPQSGEETRKQLKDKFDDASDYVKDTASDLGDRAGKAYSKGKSAATEYVGKGKDLASDYISKGKDAVGGATDDLSAASEETAERVQASV